MNPSKEIEFSKYKTRGSDYHWRQISYNLHQRNAYVLGRYKNMVSLLKREIINPKDKLILDLGCGDGVLSYFLDREGYRVKGIDYSNIAISEAKKKLKNTSIEFKQGNAYELPYRDNSFDAIVSTEVIEHLQNVDQYLIEIKRCLKPKGVIIISTPIRITHKPLDSNHVTEWFPNEFKKIIDAQFSKSNYFFSHPVALMELMNYSMFGKINIFRLFINFISLFSNPFERFDSRFRYLSIQYSVSKNND